MGTAPCRSIRALGPACAALALMAGCATNRPVDNALRTQAGSPSSTQIVNDGYHIRCPDLVEVTVELRGDVPTGQRQVGPDGCVDLGPLGRVRVEGLTPLEAAGRVAKTAGVPPAAAQLRLVDY